MYITTPPFSILLLSILFPLTSSSSLPDSALDPQYIFSNPLDATNRIPTSRESAVLARRILNLTPLATISTIFPNSTSSTRENRPENLADVPIGLMDYIADCEPETNNPTILAISIATSFKNALTNPNISLALSWTPPYPPKSRISFSSKPDPYAYSAANLPRYSLIGYLEPIPEEETSNLGKCFVDTHPDAKYWLPGNRIHHSEWMRMVVREIYWVGGFGDRAYIGWIPVDEWRSVQREEWANVRLVGERKGWKEWAVEGLGLGGESWEL